MLREPKQTRLQHLFAWCTSTTIATFSVAGCGAHVPEGQAHEGVGGAAAVDVVSALPQALLADEIDALEDPLAPEGDLLSVTIANGVPGVGRVERGAVKRSKATKEELSDRKLPSAAPTNIAPPGPKLSAAIPGNSMVDVLIRYADQPSVRLPRLPRLNPDEARDSANNTAVREKAGRLIQHVQALRAADHARHGDGIRGRGGKVNSEYWLLNALSAQVPRDQLQALADDPEVVSITSEDLSGPYDATIGDGRTMMNTDPYFNVSGINTGYIGLLDSGTRRTHLELNGRIDFWRDCVNGTSSHCTVAAPGLTLDPSDTWMPNGHGTSLAHIMSGIGSLGASERGVTGIRIDSFMVGHQAANNPSVIRAFQAALAATDDVINCSFTCGGSDAEASICDDAADSAFNSGALVVAAMNNVSGQSVIHPAAGKMTLAVGNVDINRVRNTSFSSQGPAADGRTKPDLMGLGTSVNAATNFSDNLYANRTGTSIATPFVTAASALMRRWLKIAFPNTGLEPGNTAAMMIASGSNSSTPTNNFMIGAGVPTLPAGSTVTLFISKVNVMTNVNSDLSIAVPSGRTTLKAALWWPEAKTVHNDVDLSVISQTGTTIAWSNSTSSIWEKAQATVASGTTVKVRARGYSVNGTQPVYVAVIVQ